MALITSAASGNFNAGATWTGGVVPGVGDEARASTGHTVTITADATCDEVSNAGTGIFTLASGVTLTANVTSKSTTISRNCLQFTAASPAVGTIVGNCTGGTVTGAFCANNTASGTLNITGNATGGSGTSSYAIQCSTGIINITGNVTGGNAGGGQCSGIIMNSVGGTANIVGNVTGGSGNASNYGLWNNAVATVNITGICDAGAVANGAHNATTGTIKAARVVGNAYGPGNNSGLAAAVGASNAGLGVIEIQELEFGQYGMSPTSGSGIRLKKVSTNQTIFNYVDAGAAKTLVDATTGEMPAVTDVRTGVSYASGALTGTCAVPAAASVGFGVPVDATSGTAALTPAAVWEYATRLLTTSSGPTAVQIRQEMDSNSTKLANLDATVSSRLASSAYSAAPTTAQIATAVEGSLLNEADGQAVLNAIVGAIGNQNLSEVSLVAAIRTDLERTGGKIDSIPTTAAPTAAANATAVWATATKTITGGTVDTLTNSPSVPSAASIASATRTELTTELGRLDAAVSTRLATSGYTAPSSAPTAAANASAVRTELATELAKVSALNTDRLANVATTAIVGNLIAQANS